MIMILFFGFRLGLLFYMLYTPSSSLSFSCSVFSYSVVKLTMACLLVDPSHFIQSLQSITSSPRLLYSLRSYLPTLFVSHPDCAFTLPTRNVHSHTFSTATCITSCILSLCYLIVFCYSTRKLRMRTRTKIVQLEGGGVSNVNFSGR
ncbi:hypothetical protein BJ165DRAFT_239727 [Panaeolus papilionaceus]|nr:hypothetical protein BJ165DRAFT_239727 [Panaeolus papilionaceus]